jgi:MFS family permease
VITGGFVFDKVGGYNGPNAMPIIVVVGGISSFAAFMSVLFNSPYAVAAFMTLQLFGGGLIMPVATGIMLNLVTVRMRTNANSIANLSYNLFGYVPAPYIYGWAY